MLSPVAYLNQVQVHTLRRAMVCLDPLPPHPNGLETLIPVSPEKWKEVLWVLDGGSQHLFTSKNYQGCLSPCENGFEVRVGWTWKSGYSMRESDFSRTFDVFSPTASRMSALNASSFTVSPS